MSYSKNKLTKSQRNRIKKYYIKDKLSYWNQHNKFVQEARKNWDIYSTPYETKQAYLIIYKVFESENKFKIIKFIAYKEKDTKDFIKTKNNRHFVINPEIWDFNIASKWSQYEGQYKESKLGTLFETTNFDISNRWDKKLIDSEHENVYSYFYYKDFYFEPKLISVELLEGIELDVPIDNKEFINSIDNEYQWLIKRNFIVKTYDSFVSREFDNKEHWSSIHIPSHLVYPRTKYLKEVNREDINSRIRENTYKKVYKNEYFDSELTQELVDNGYHFYSSKLSKK